MNRKRKYIAMIVLLAAVLSVMPAFLAGTVKANAGKAIADLPPLNRLGFKTAAENSNLVLYINPEGQFVIEHKKSGYRWRSNPELREEDTVAKGVFKMQLHSQLLVTYSTGKGETSTTNNYVASTKENGAFIERTKRGFKAVYNFPKQNFIIPVEYTLESDHLRAEIVLKEIEEHDPESQITQIGFLPYLGAGGASDSGYLFVPDGSGALIRFNNGKSGYEAYRQQLYGNDDVLTQAQGMVSRQRASLPVFGVKNGDHAILAVIDSGDSLGTVRAAVSGMGTSYNHVYSEFTYRQLDNAKLLSRTWAAKEVKLLAKTASQLERIAVNFYFLNGEDGDYSGMARRYQQYLLEEKRMRKTVTAGQVPFYLDLYGAAAKRKTFLGFPYTKMEALTTYAQSEEIVDQLLKAGVGHIVLQYKGWANDGLTNNKLPSAVSPISKLGGKSGFKRLLEYMSQNQIRFYPAVDLIHFRASGNGFSSRSDTAGGVTKLAAPQYAYVRSTYQVNDKVKPQYLLSPLKMLEAARKLMQSYEQFSHPQMALNELGSQVYSDYRKGGTDRGKTANIWAAALGKFNEQTYSLLLQQPNGYALPYAAHAAQLAVESSSFDIEDEAVPFYQMVLHGIIPYSVPAVNLSSDPETMLLKAIETGSSLQYAWMYAPASAVKDTPYNELYSTHYRDWVDSAVAGYKELQQILYKVADKRMTAHRQLEQGVYETVYENGLRVIVNYNEYQTVVEGRTVEAKGYLVADGAGKG
ncbi:DUF5696 domain-containing protein [Paenibacillus sp. GCM10027626]|uniref:DUF5696 domain-containing protein n=1 Tax=Paenibacillus sp. GCM10027626 TaxID=3273411 RepID=UPI0036409AC0